MQTAGAFRFEWPWTVLRMILQKQVLNEKERELLKLHAYVSHGPAACLMCQLLFRKIQERRAEAGEKITMRMNS